jgi:hypothetical protein
MPRFGGPATLQNQRAEAGHDFIEQNGKRAEPTKLGIPVNGQPGPNVRL